MSARTLPRAASAARTNSSTCAGALPLGYHTVGRNAEALRSTDLHFVAGHQALEMIPLESALMAVFGLQELHSATRCACMYMICLLKIALACLLQPRWRCGGSLESVSRAGAAQWGPAEPGR